MISPMKARITTNMITAMAAIIPVDNRDELGVETEEELAAITPVANPDALSVATEAGVVRVDEVGVEVVDIGRSVLCQFIWNKGA
jgi:hypothetical protein